MSNDPNAAVRSPSYPVQSLADAITAVRKIEAQYRSAKVDREVAAKVIGYSSLSGPANKALAALAQYGLVERAGKGEMRVTSRARAILHPDSESEKRVELRAAAFEPRLFQDLQERYPNMMPPEDGVVMFLNRKGFNQNAIRPAAKAYLQTLLFLQEEGATESHGIAQAEAADSNADQPMESAVEASANAGRRTLVSGGVPLVPAAYGNAEPDLNTINMNIRGDKVHLDALLDYDGLLDLEKKLVALKVLLKVYYDANDIGDQKAN
jgi:hypothetical protein